MNIPVLEQIYACSVECIGSPVSLYVKDPHSYGLYVTASLQIQ